MTLESAIAFTLAMTVFSLSPGPGIAAALAHAVQRGFMPAMALLTGLVVGDAIYLVAAVSGLAALALAFENLLAALRIASGIYLIYLGVQTIRDSKQTLAPADSALAQNQTKPNSSPRSPSSLNKSFLLGVGITFGNPKVVLFYLGLMPSFLDLERMTISDTLIALAILVIVSYATYAPLSYLAISASRNVASGRWTMLAKRLAGLILCLVGLSIAASPLAAL